MLHLKNVPASQPQVPLDSRTAMLFSCRSRVISSIRCHDVTKSIQEKIIFSCLGTFVIETAISHSKENSSLAASLEWEVNSEWFWWGPACPYMRGDFPSVSEEWWMRAVAAHFNYERYSSPQTQGSHFSGENRAGFQLPSGIITLCHWWFYLHSLGYFILLHTNEHIAGLTTLALSRQSYIFF